MTGLDALKEFIGKDKKRLFLLAALVLGIMLLLFAGWGGNEQTEENNTDLQLSNEQFGKAADNGAQQQDNLLAGEEQRLAAQLTEILQQISGVGQVAVKVRLAASSSSEYATDNSSTHKLTEENDQAGGSRVINEESSEERLVLSADSEKPWLLSRQSAVIAGVVVAADGADNAAVKADLIYAVQAYCSLELNKIVVLPREKTEIIPENGGKQ